jgi:hypothetical protein
MEWVIAGLVPVLVIAWRYLWARSKPPRRHVMTDVRGALADRLQQLASDARAGNHHREAQQLEYQARWLRTRPTDIGGDAPPEALLAADERHVRFAGAVWEEYGQFLANDGGQYAGCRFRPQATLPFTKEGIAAALQLLLDIGEGRAACAFIDTRSIPAEALDSMRQALLRLADFLDVPAGELPTDPEDNEAFGVAHEG